MYCGDGEPVSGVEGVKFTTQTQRSQGNNHYFGKKENSEFLSTMLHKCSKTSRHHIFSHNL
jgi:hypothetical protein